MKLGILGGTFDPIHVGHLAAARAAMECAGLDRVVFMPSAEPPHRSAAGASAQQRLEMCRLAIRGEDRFDVTDLEIRRGGVSYTLDSLLELKRAHPADQLYLVLGADAARLFHTWHEPERVKQLAIIIVVRRPGASDPDEALLTSAGLDSSRVIPCPSATPNISGSALRRAFAAGESILDQVPDGVAAYIAAHDLYRDNR